MLKSTVTTFDAATRIALQIDSALCREKREESGGYFSLRGQQIRASSSSDPVPMEIGNIQVGNRRPLTEAQKQQKRLDRKNNACYLCHKQNCRPCKCNPISANNSELEPSPGLRDVEADSQELSDSESNRS